jgi:cell division protein FtsL
VVSVASPRRTSSVAASPSPRAKDTEAAFLSKWLKVWVGLLCVVTLVVVVYLTVITNSLANVNGNLGTVSREVTGAGTNAVGLPNHVDRINASLGQIDTALKPIPGQAGEIVNSLTSVNDKLSQTDASLQETAGILQGVLGSVGDIGGALVDADEPGDNLGVQDIHQRIARINGRNSPAVGTASAGGGAGPFGASPANLSTVRTDATAIAGGINSINTHLLGVCRSLVGNLLTQGLVGGLLGGLLGAGGSPSGTCA